MAKKVVSPPAKRRDARSKNGSQEKVLGLPQIGK